MVPVDAPEILGPLLAYGLTSDGREVCVRRRMYNTMMTIGPVGLDWYQTHW